MKKLLAIVVAAAAILVVSAPAAGHTKVFGGTLSLVLQHGPTPAQDSAVGTIGDTRLVCSRSRLVKLFQVTAQGPKEIDSETTDSTGSFSMSVPGAIKAGDTYFTTAKRKVAKKRAGHRHICKALASPVVIGTAAP